MVTPCAICLLIALLPASAQDGNAPQTGPQTNSGNLVLKTQRQKWAALNDAKRLSDKAEKFQQQGKWNDAERTAEQALSIEEQVRGPWDLKVADRLDQVADLYRVHKKENSAAPLYERARAIRERALSTHPDIYGQQDGELRIKRNQPAEKVGAGRPSSPQAAPPTK